MIEWKMPFAAVFTNTGLNEMDLLMSIILLGSGAYCTYTWLRLLVTKRLFPNGLLVPKNKKPSDCTDEQAYIRYILPPLTLTAFVTMAYGLLVILESLLSVTILPYPWGLAPVVATLGTLVWYAVRNGRANREYFGM